MSFANPFKCTVLFSLGGGTHLEIARRPIVRSRRSEVDAYVAVRVEADIAHLRGHRGRVEFPVPFGSVMLVRRSAWNCHARHVELIEDWLELPATVVPTRWWPLPVFVGEDPVVIGTVALWPTTPVRLQSSAQSPAR